VSSERTARRLAILGTVLSAAALISAVLLFVKGRSERSRLEREIVQLKTQLSSDRHSRVVRVAAIDAERRRLSDREASVAAELEALREAERTLRLELAEARTHAAAGGTEVAGLKVRLDATRSLLGAFELERSRAEQMIGALQGGVAFVEGAYGFQDAAGVLLRFAGFDAKGNPETDAEGKPVLSGSGTGPVVRMRYTGTAFLVSPDGTLLTNRHIAEPWWRNAAAKELAGKGYSPRMTSLRAYFPGVPDPFDLRVISLSDEVDLAVVAVVDGAAVVTDAKTSGASKLGRLPALPVDAGKPPPVSGQPIVLLGYPTGLDALLARLDETLMRSIVDAADGDSVRIAAELARLGLIRPLATQGHLSDVLPGRLVYDAQTTLGGSGGPVLNARGRVIGINAAILTEFSGASFGVPVRFASVLLPAPPKAPGPKLRKAPP
jgi:S1-C subfamily serine protease